MATYTGTDERLQFLFSNVGIFCEYSTTEKVVGHGTDDKPIYQQTFDGLSISVASTGTWNQSGIVLQDVKRIIRGEVIDEDGQSFPAAFGVDSQTDEILIDLATIAGATRVIECVTIWYKKSTD